MHAAAKIAKTWKIRLVSEKQWKSRLGGSSRLKLRFLHKLQNLRKIRKFAKICWTGENQQKQTIFRNLRKFGKFCHWLMTKSCDLVNERENSSKSQFTRKFVNLTINRKFYNERAKNCQSCSFYCDVFARGKNRNFSAACKPSTKVLSSILCLSVRRVPCCVELHSGTVLVLLSLLSLANRGCTGSWVKISPLKQFGSLICLTPTQV